VELLQEELGLVLQQSFVEELDYAALSQAVNGFVKAMYDEHTSHLPIESRREVQRILYLQTLDENWRDHLYQMDILKTGIGLRGYNQKDPLVEYKKESYKLFTDLVESVKINAARVLHTVRFQTEESSSATSHNEPQQPIALGSGISMPSFSVTQDNSVSQAELRKAKRQSQYDQKKS
jgi:preprotein translocase subunit SecA